VKWKHAARLLEVHAAVDTQDHDGIDVARHLLDRVVDLHPVGFHHLTRESLDPGGAVLDVGTAALEARDNDRPVHVLWIFRIIEDLGERHGVRRIEANQADLERCGRGEHCPCPGAGAQHGEAQATADESRNIHGETVGFLKTRDRQQ